MSVNNILQYESNIWATVDLLRGCGIKESGWPSYMMPFFALVMIESRLVYTFDELKVVIEGVRGGIGTIKICGQRLGSRM